MPRGRSRWLAELPDGERRYLHAVAGTPAESRTSSAIAASMNDAASKWGWARSRLIDRGLLRPDGYGRVTFALPGLEEHLAAWVPGTPSAHHGQGQ